MTLPLPPRGLMRAPAMPAPYALLPAGRGSLGALGASFDLSAGKDVVNTYVSGGPDAKTPCGKIAVAGEATPADWSACGRSLFSGDADATFNTLTGAARDVAVAASYSGGTAICTATGAGAAISPLCGVVTSKIAGVVLEPVFGFLTQQYELAKCIVSCDCMADADKRAREAGRKAYDQLAPLCQDATCRAYLRSRYITHLPWVRTKFKVAGVKVRTCTKAVIPTMPGPVQTHIVWGLPITFNTRVPYVPGADLFERSAERAGAFAAAQAHELLVPAVKGCMDNTCRNLVADAATIAGSSIARAAVQSDVVLPGAKTTWATKPDKAKYASLVKEAKATFQSISTKAAGESHDRAIARATAQGQQALDAYTSMRGSASYGAGKAALDEWLNAQGAHALWFDPRSWSKRARTYALYGLGAGALVLAGTLLGRRRAGGRKMRSNTHQTWGANP